MLRSSLRADVHVAYRAAAIRPPLRVALISVRRHPLILVRTGMEAGGTSRTRAEPNSLPTAAAARALMQGRPANCN